MKIGVLGGGAFGTALAIAIARSRPVTLWARDPYAVAGMSELRENTDYLSGARFPDDLAITANLETVLQADVLLFAVPMQALSVLVAPLDLSGKIAVACCKGIDLTTGQGPSALLSGAAHVAVLTGPSFARDIAFGLPTALTLAAHDERVLTDLQKVLSTPVLRLYRTTDVIGAEIGGALKNVIAIGCGAAIGAGLGDSARAALMTRGFAEMCRVADALGAQPETLCGLSGLGDLTLTCTSEGSRNYRLGLALGAGETFDVNITVEGAATARALRQVAAAHRLDLPICATVADLVDGKVNVRDAIQRLLARPLKEE